MIEGIPLMIGETRLRVGTCACGHAEHQPHIEVPAGEIVLPPAARRGLEVERLLKALSAPSLVAFIEQYAALQHQPKELEQN